MKTWNIADARGNITIPDDIAPLFNKLGFQLRLHMFSGKNEIQTVADMTQLAQKFYEKKHLLEWIPIKSLEELPEGEIWITKGDGTVSMIDHRKCNIVFLNWTGLNLPIAYMPHIIPKPFQL